MQGQHLFEYAVIRVVPKVEREEFMNVGIVLYCREQKFLRTKFRLDRERLLSFSAQLDLAEIEAHLLSFCRICEGSSEGGLIATFTLPERFRWMTAIRSTVVQTSRVHPGFCTDAGATLERLYEQMTL